MPALFYVTIYCPPIPVDGGALGTVVVVADGVGVAVGEGDGEVVCANATPKVISPETPSPAAP